MSNGKFSTPESEYSNGWADGSYEADHDDRPLTDEQLAELSEPYARGYRVGYFVSTDKESEAGQ